MAKFDAEVGYKYLGGIHLNDSKVELGANRDLHENIGLGRIGLTGFRALMRDPGMVGIPMVLETPSGPAGAVEAGELDIWSREIKLLYEIQGVPDEEWDEKKSVIEARWRSERDAIDPPKDKKKAVPKKGGKKKKTDDDSGSECDH
jgi:AP endonuclease-1